MLTDDNCGNGIGDDDGFDRSVCVLSGGLKHIFLWIMKHSFYNGLMHENPNDWNR